MGGTIRLINALKNIKYSKKGNYVLFSINPEIYPLDVIYFASYVLLDRAYIILDGNPKKEIKVEIRKKEKKQDLKQLVFLFNYELLNYSTYKILSEKNKNLREIILQKLLMTHTNLADTKGKVKGIYFDNKK